jgi:pimeloyl-ACP methyl ester carboxylesterase
MSNYPALVLACVAITVFLDPSRTLLAQSGGEAIVPYRIDVPDQVLSDLKERLARTRYPSEIEGSGWDYGTNLAYLKELVTYWQTRFDWREQERKLNQLPQFLTTIDGIDIHFVHQRSSHLDATPLVLIHGWPGTVVEFTKVIGPLTEPTKHGGRAEDAFHVVAVSLPGFGFSGKPRVPGYSPRRMAETIAQLMARLGYTRYGAQGGDWGGNIVRHLGLIDAAHLIGLHSNLCDTDSSIGPNSNDGVPASELTRLAAMESRLATEWGYFELQSTKPMTLGYGLNDSPAGLAAWIVEKFRTWSDSSGDVVEKKFTKDELLANITIYWVTETAPSSVRIYFENRIDPGPGDRIEVPTACARFPGEPFDYAPRKWFEVQYNLVQFTEMPRGGHFAAMEEPELLVEDVRKFFRTLRAADTFKRP